MLFLAGKTTASTTPSLRSALRRQRGGSRVELGIFSRRRSDSCQSFAPWPALFSYGCQAYARLQLLVTPGESHPLDGLTVKLLPTASSTDQD